MIHLERTRRMEASPEAVWAVLSDFMHVDAFAPLITSVEALTEGENGVGSKRRNYFENGSSVVEEIIAWEPGRSFTVRLSEMDAMPLHEATSQMSVKPVRDHCDVTWTFDYRVKYGPLGWLMGQTLMKMMMGKIINGNLKGLAEKV